MSTFPHPAYSRSWLSGLRQCYPRIRKIPVCTRQLIVTIVEFHHLTTAILFRGSKDIPEFRGAYKTNEHSVRGASRTQVAIKPFRILPAQELKKFIEVSTSSPFVVGLQTQFTDSVEAGADVEEANPWKHLAILWRGHCHLLTCPRFRLGAKRKHQSV